MPAWYAAAATHDERHSPLVILARDAAFLELDTWRQAILAAVRQAQDQGDEVILALDVLPITYLDVSLQRSLIPSTINLGASPASSQSSAALLLLRFQTRLLDSLADEVPAHVVDEEVSRYDMLVDASHARLTNPSLTL